ncbi:MAG: Asp-tRNA(Asn)/Glu-tRNA(Gln) amidotransferase subunit GatB [Cyclobacteriaceae bacterium]
MLSQEIKDQYEAVIGLEVHVQLLTESKIFAGDSNKFGSDPNTNISVITLGHPGTMPKMNKKVITHAIRMGLACHSKIERFQYFDRKNYFYPDLPKGYQTTQDNRPVCIGGHVPVKTTGGLKKDIRLNRIHMEEDAGKSIHLPEGDARESLVDYNRAGVPLIEIVTEPELYSSEEAAAFLNEIRKLVRYLKVSDGNMEEGSMRCDANISVRKKGDPLLGKKVEVKNMNSIRNVSHAINYEIDRQIAKKEKGEEILSETRLFDVPSGTTSGMRTKEALNDYRYFPCPDLSPMEVTEEWLDSLKADMPALPAELVKKFTETYQLPEYDAYVLTETRELAEYFMKLGDSAGNFKIASNWLMGPVKSYLNLHNLEINEFPIKPEKLAEVLKLIADNVISNTAADRQLLPVLIQNPDREPLEIAKDLELLQDSDSNSILPIIEEVLVANQNKVKAYKTGKKGLLGFFVGEVMKNSKGKADPKLTNQLLREKLEK